MPVSRSSRYPGKPGRSNAGATREENDGTAWGGRRDAKSVHPCARRSARAGGRDRPGAGYCAHVGRLLVQQPAHLVPKCKPLPWPDPRKSPDWCPGYEITSRSSLVPPPCGASKPRRGTTLQTVSRALPRQAAAAAAPARERASGKEVFSSFLAIMMKPMAGHLSRSLANGSNFSLTQAASLGNSWSNEQRKTFTP